VRPPQVKKQLQKLMWDHVGLVRSGPKLEETLRALRETREHVLPTVKVTNKARVLNREWMESIELENILDIGEAMAAASIPREETRGAFYRTDFPELDPQWTANVWVMRDGKALKVEKHPVQTRVGAKPAEPTHKAALTLGEV
jgi:succinate dehydrogenase/fumarate reductase flavoprotein subunit